MGSATDQAGGALQRSLAGPVPAPPAAVRTATPTAAASGPSRRLERVLVIDGHPRADSLCSALAHAYATGAQQAGMEVRRLRLADLVFDLQVRTSPMTAQEIEPALGEARAWLQWCDHLVLVYPLWWGSMPALVKGFLDRLLAPGFAFVERPDRQGYRGLLGGRSAQLLVTMDTPPWAYRLILGRPGVKAMRRDVLGFCGLHPVHVRLHGPVLHSSARQRECWLAKAQALGAALPDLPAGTIERVMTWLRALRLQFYPMTWAAYSLGALAAATEGRIDGWAYWLGYAGIFALEAATVLTNDLVDRDGDALNQHYGPFNGGSRMLVDGRLRGDQALIGIALALVLGASAFGAALGRSGASWPEPTALLAVGACLCLGYAAPPLRLSYRGLGEITVASTHSALVIMLGWLLQGGSPASALPWALALPLGLAILPSIILANVPDRRADVQVGKRTMAVLVGNRAASALALWCALAATVASGALALVPASRGLLDGVAAGAAVHAALLGWLISRYRQRGAPDGRIDALIVAALTFMLWFVLIPIVHAWK